MQQKSLKRVSNMLIFVGGFAFALAVYFFMTASPKVAAAKPKLKLAPRAKLEQDQQPDESFMDADGSFDITQLANMASIFIWGLVLTKAKSGLEAADTKESGTVGGLLSKAVSIIVLIGVSAIFKLVANITGTQPAFPTYQEVQTVSKPVLKQSAIREYPDSYYDEASPHYMGGAHNVALMQLKNGNIPQPKDAQDDFPASYYDESSPHYMGGAHNVALKRLKESSKRRVEESNPAYMKLLGDVYRS